MARDSHADRFANPMKPPGRPRTYLGKRSCKEATTDLESAHRLIRGRVRQPLTSSGCGTRLAHIDTEESVGEAMTSRRRLAGSVGPGSVRQDFVFPTSPSPGKRPMTGLPFIQ